MNIWLGPAGVGVGSKDRSTLGGIKYVAEIKLNSMEIEYVHGVKMSIDTAKEVGDLAKKLNIRLSCHAPYFINLCSEEKYKLEASKRMILDSVERAHCMHAKIIVFHPGYYQKLSEKEAFQKIKEACEDMLDRMKKHGFDDVILGLETTGKISQFGTLDELVKLCMEVNGCSPVVDWSHIYARQAGRINFSEIFDKISVLKPEHMHTHISGIEFFPAGRMDMGNEKYHLPLSTKKPDFEPLVREILKREIDITLISESPILEKDALLLKNMFEEAGYEF